MSTPAKTIPVIRITNPFNAREFVRETLPFDAIKTLADYFPTGSAEHVISINGKIIEERDWPVTYLGPDDNLVLCPVPQGGGGKNILRLVAILAVAYFAPEIAYGMYSAGGGTMTAAAFAASGMGAAMTAGVVMAGSMLVNAMLPVPKPNGGSSDSTTSYGVDGAKNTSLEGIPVPICYGGFEMGGNVLDLYVENVDRTQNLYLLLNAGEGPVSSLTNIQINDQPIANYSQVETQLRLGDASQSLIDWFANTIVPYSLNLELTADAYRNYTTTEPVDKLRFDLVAPSGLFKLNSDGGTDSVSVDLQIEYQRVGDSAWISAGDNNVIASYAIQYIYAPQQTFDENGQVTSTTAGYTTDMLVQGDIVQTGWMQADGEGTIVRNNIAVGSATRVAQYSTGITMSEKRQSAVRMSITTPPLEHASYNVRMRRINPRSADNTLVDAVYISDVNEILTAGASYPYTALVGVKVKLTDQLNGMPKVTFINSGMKIREWDSINGIWNFVASQNPAWIVWDMLTNSRYGGGMAESRLDVEKFKEWGAYCAAKNLTFKGVFDASGNLWDSVQDVLRAGHAQIVNIGTRWSIIMEREDDPMMMFSVANIIDGTFKETWLSMSDRANEIELSYFDETDRFKQKTVRVADPNAVSAGRPAQTSSITMRGVTTVERATKEAWFQLNLNRYILQTVEFAAPIDAIACTVGDLVFVQHDMPQWGFAGRFESGSTSSNVVLDREVPMEGGKQYKLLALYDALNLYSGSVISVAGTTLLLSDFDNSQTVKRIQVGGRDLAVRGTVFAGGSTYGVVVDDTTGIALGSPYTLWNTDVIIERDVVNTATTGANLILQSPFPQAPAQFSQWMFGEVTKVKKPFRVKTISGTGDYRRDITALEYNASVYDLDGVPVPTPNYSSLFSGTQQVTITGATEEEVTVGGNVQTRVTVHFKSGQETYKSSRVYASINGAAMFLLDPDAVDRAYIDADDRATIVFKVVACDILGVYAPDSSAPTLTYTVHGKISKPLNVSGFNATGDLFQNILNWSWVAQAGVEKVEIWASASSSNVNNAVKLTDQAYPTSSWTHMGLGLGVTINYWTRTCDTNGNYSDWSAMVSATTSSDPSKLLAALTGQITSDQLYSTLRDSIDAVAGDQNSFGSLTNKLAYLEAQLATMTASAAALASARILVDADAAANLEAEAAARGTAITNEQTVRQQGDEQLADQITILTASSVGLDTADNAAWYFDADAMGFTAVGGTLSWENGAIEIDSAGAAPQLFSPANLTVDGSKYTQLRLRITRLAGTGWNGTLAWSGTGHGFDTTHEATIDAPLNLDAGKAVVANYDLTDVAVWNTDTITQIRLDLGASAADRFTVDWIAIGRVAPSASWAALESEQTARSTAVSALAEDLTALAAKVDGNEATLTTDYMTAADTTSAISSAYSMLRARLDNADGTNDGITLEQAMSANASSIAGLNAQYTVKVDANGYVTGFGLATTIKNGTPTSSFIINADKFAVVTPGKNPKTPFIVGSVNGTSMVGIDGALVVDNTITAQKVDSRGLTIKDTNGRVLLDAGSINGLNLTTFTTGASNVLLNPTAVQGLNYWGSWRDGGGSEFYTTRGGAGEGYYFQHTANTPYNKGIYQTVSLYEGSQMTLTVDVFAGGCNSGGYCYASVDCYDGANNFKGSICYSQAVSGAGWTTLSATGIAPPGTRTCNINFVQIGYSTNTAAKNFMFNSGGRIPFKDDASTYGSTFGDYNGSGNNVVGQITAGNIGVFMQSAAIQTAYIADAIINNAKVQDLQVNGRKISGQAITNLSSLGTVGSGGVYFNVPAVDDINSNNSVAVQIGGNLPGQVDFGNGVTSPQNLYIQPSWAANTQSWSNIIATVGGSQAPGFSSITVGLPPGGYFIFAAHSDPNQTVRPWPSDPAYNVYVLSVKK